MVCNAQYPALSKSSFMPYSPVYTIAVKHGISERTSMHQHLSFAAFAPGINSRCAVKRNTALCTLPQKCLVACCKLSSLQNAGLCMQCTRRVCVQRDGNMPCSHCMYRLHSNNTSSLCLYCAVPACNMVQPVCNPVVAKLHSTSTRQYTQKHHRMSWSRADSNHCFPPSSG